MQGINISAFFVGAATMYFLLNAVQILSQKHRTRYQTTLGWIFVVWTLSNLKDIIITFPELYTERVQNYILLVDGWMALSYVVLIFEVTMPGWTTLRRILLLCIPWIAFTLAYALWPSTAIMRAYAVYLWCFAWTIVGIAYVKIRRYNRYIRDNFSNIEHIDISWLRYIFWFCIISQLSWLVTAVMYSVYADALYYASTILLWQMVIHYSYHFTPITMVAPQPLETPVKDYPFSEELDRLMTQKKLYLKTNLSLEELAYQLHTNRTYLSDYFNHVKHVTFFDYINQLRIEYSAIPLIHEHPEYTLDYIAAKSGFNSISTFRRSFQKLTGVSPSSYRKQLETTPPVAATVPAEGELSASVMP